MSWHESADTASQPLGAALLHAASEIVLTASQSQRPFCITVRPSPAPNPRPVVLPRCHPRPMRTRPSPSVADCVQQSAMPPVPASRSRLHPRSHLATRRLCRGRRCGGTTTTTSASRSRRSSCARSGPRPFTPQPASAEGTGSNWTELARRSRLAPSPPYPSPHSAAAGTGSPLLQAHPLPLCCGFSHPSLHLCPSVSVASAPLSPSLLHRPVTMLRWHGSGAGA